MALAALAADVGTPVYVYSRADLLARGRAFLAAARAVAGTGALVCYAVKANGNPALLGLLREAGLGADVTSGGELFLARHAGVAPEHIIFSGVGKKETEIEEALQAGIRALHVESEMELAAVAAVAAVMLAALPLMIGIQFLIAFLHHDVDNVPREPLSADDRDPE